MDVKGGGEFISPVEIAKMHIHIADFLSRQALAGADMDVLTDIGYPAMDTTDFEVHAEVRVSGHAAGRTDSPVPAETAAAAGKPAAKYRRLRKSRRPRDLAAGDMRPDLKPFPYGSKED